MPERAQAAAARPVPGRAGGEVLALADANMAEMYRLDARATREGFVVERAGLVMCGAPTNGPVTNMAMATGTAMTKSARRGLAMNSSTRFFMEGRKERHI